MKLIPKNWHKHQHYKDRSPPWIKMHREILNDREFMCLPIASKALAPLMWLLASESKDGVFDASPEELSFRLRMTEDEIRSGLMPLINKGFFITDSEMLADCYQVAIPETETETETEDKNTYVGSKLPDCPHVKLIQIYRECLPNLTQPRVWEGTRAGNMKARWRFVLTNTNPKGEPYATDEETALAFFRKFFNYVAKCDFLVGKTSEWQCDLPWLMKAENFNKVIEGKYQNKEAA